MKLKIIILTIIVFILSTAVISPVSAGSTVTVNGIAEVLQTGGKFRFNENNSALTVDSVTGELTGFVWSEDLGWIDFDNNGNAGAAKVNLTNGHVTGLAYVPNTDGFLDFDNYNSNVLINLTSGAISGYVWSEDVGWVSFEGVSIPGGLLPLTQTGVNLILGSVVSLFALTTATFIIFTKKNALAFVKARWITH